MEYKAPKSAQEAQKEENKLWEYKSLSTEFASKLKPLQAKYETLKEYVSDCDENSNISMQYL